MEKKFVNYPVPKAGPQIPYQARKDPNNPALRGVVLVVAAVLLEWLWFLRQHVWQNTGFNSLRGIFSHIVDYEPRFDPNVIVRSENPSPGAVVSSAKGKAVETIRIDKQDSKLADRAPYTVADYHRLYLSGEITPTAVVKAILPLIRRDSSPPGEHSSAWLQTRSDLALAAAEASTLRYREKRPIGIFDGVPTGVKDEYDVEGYATTLGSLRDYAPETASKETDSWCVRKMEEAGAVILGKLSMHEYGLDTSGNNPFYGTPPNPYNPNYYTGGSSSGTAYAVSAGLIPVGMGSDGGGSIRLPSSFCSVFGLKPSHNRVAHYPSTNYSSTCGVNGPIASDIASLAAFFQVIAVPDPVSEADWGALPPLVLQPTSRKPKLLGIPEAWFAHSQPAVHRLCRSLVDELVHKRGYHLVPVEIPFLAEGQLAHAMTVLNDAATLIPDPSALSAPNKILICLGRETPATDFLLAQKLRQLLMQHLAHLWQQHPGMLLVTPAAACAGWPVRDPVELRHGVSDGDQTLKTMRYVWMANFLGLPALTVPAGYVIAEGQTGAGQEAAAETFGKVPVGLMAMAEWGDEELLLQWGTDAELAGSNRRCKPPIWVDVMARARDEMR